jgi:hypothetical protein
MKLVALFYRKIAPHVKKAMKSGENKLQPAFISFLKNKMKKKVIVGA